MHAHKACFAAIVAILLTLPSPLRSARAPAGLLRFERGDTLDVLRDKIRHNGFSFRVGHNWVYDMPPEMKEEFLSRRKGHIRPGVSDDIGPVIKYLGDPLPASFDWRNRDGKSYIGPVRDQGGCGSCYAFGACAAAEGAYNRALGLFNENCADFSEAFLAWCLGSLPEYFDHFGGCDGADFEYQELQALVDYGICRESDFPYSEAAYQSCPEQSWNAQRGRFGSWHRVGCGDVDAVKAAIMNYGVVDAALWVDSGIEAYAGGVYDDANTSCDGSPCEYSDTNHAIALVGWDDNPPEGGGGCWILRNSWGTDWGEQGYMRIRYHAARVACEVSYLAGPYEYDPPAPPQAAVSPVVVSIARNSFSAFYDSMSVAAAAAPISTPCYVFFRIVTPYYGTLYLTSEGGILKYPAPYFPDPLTIPSQIAGYSIATLKWSYALPGSYRIESGAVHAYAPVNTEGKYNYLNGTYDSKVFSIR